MVILKLASGILLILFGLILSAKIIYASADPYNLVPNPSFEEGDVNPIAWIPVSGVSCVTQNQTSNPIPVWENSFARTGNRSLALKNISWSSEPNGKPGWMTNDFIQVDLYSAYRIGVSYAGQNNNINLQANLYVCFYDSDSNNIGLINTPTTGISGARWDRYLNNFSTANGAVSKIKIGVTPVCPFNRPCSGSIWFDDISLRPGGSNLLIRKFNDLNGNSQKDVNEPPLEWQFYVYEHPNCVDKNDRYRLRVTTDEEEGWTMLLGMSVGEFSVREIMKDGWSNTTPICQNITVPLKINTPIVSVHFGNIQTPPFPYFSQKDPAWGGQEYDSANTFGPFFCGTTLAQCGCATTSSAMLLKYYGVDKSPTGYPTSPQSLDNWLKQNNGYAFGAVKWNSIAAYSVKANQTFGTQKIKFSGVAPADDLSTLNQDLNNNNPPILQQPGHFIVATGIQSPTYSIADPAWENRKTLESYGDTFRSMRRFEKTNTDLSAIYIATPAPTELLITDSQGRITGKDASGNIFNQIPNSHYALEPAFSDPSSENPQAPPENLGINTLIILTPDLQNYTLETFSQSPIYSIEFSGYDEDGDITTQGFDQTGADQYDIEYSEVGSRFEFFQTVEIDARHSAKSNPFNPKSKILPVSILPSSDFDPKEVDIESVIPELLGWTLLKNSTIFVGPQLQDGKGLLLLLQTNGDYQEEVCIRGKTLSGEPFRGCDSITVVGNGP